MTLIDTFRVKRGYIHVKETAPPFAIAIEPNSAGHDTGSGVYGDSEKVGRSGTESELYVIGYKLSINTLHYDVS